MSQAALGAGAPAACILARTPREIHHHGIHPPRSLTRIERFAGRNGTASDTRSVKEPTLLYLVRHCQSSGQAPDAPLTPLGRQQAERLATTLRSHGIARIVSSP